VADDEPARIRVVPWQGSDAELLALAGRGGPKAAAAVYDRFGRDINRLVGHLLGRDQEHDDVVHDCFVQLLKGMKKVKDPDALRSWMASVTVNTVRSHLRKRKVRRTFWASPEQARELEGRRVDHESRELLEKTYTALKKLPADERVAFVLRYVEQRPLAQVADLCGCSLATIKRRIAKADQRFARQAALDPVLSARLSASPKRSKHVAI
jgi:RNA polymerase sigma-70 factor (ECF subfamily)